MTDSTITYWNNFNANALENESNIRSIKFTDENGDINEVLFNEEGLVLQVLFVNLAGGNATADRLGMVLGFTHTHTTELINETEATCESAGSAVYKCSDCDEMTVTTSQRLAHNFNAQGVCEDCGESYEKAFALWDTLTNGEILAVTSGGIYDYIISTPGYTTHTLVKELGSQGVNHGITSDTTTITLLNKDRKFDKGYLKDMLLLGRKVIPYIGIDAALHTVLSK